MEPINVFFQGYLITSCRKKMKLEAVHQWLSEKSYWSKNIPIHLVKQALEHSFCVHVLKDKKQVGFARLITDFTTFAYLADVFIVEEHQGKGLGKKLIETIVEQDWVKNLRRIMLATLDAHSLYEQFGFVVPAFPERFMEISRQGLYERLPAEGKEP